MSAQTHSLIEQASQLPVEERIELVDALMSTLDEPNASVDRLWASEAEDRLAAWRRGEIKIVALQDIIAKYSSS